MSTEHRLTATLTSSPAACLCLGGAWIVLLELRQAREREPLTAAWQFGHGEAAAISAHSAADRLRRGQVVHIYYAGLGIGHTRDQQASIELRGVTSVQALDPQPAAEPRYPRAEEITATKVEATPNSIASLESDDPLISKEELRRIFGGVSLTTLANWGRTPGFPKPIRFSARCIRYRLSEVTDYIASKEKRSDVNLGQLAVGTHPKSS